VIRERLLVRGVELARVLLRVERDDAQPVRPFGCGRRRLELDAQLAEHAYGAVAERLEQPAAGGVRLQDAVLDPACAAAGRLLLEPCDDQLPDPAPDRVRVDVPLGAPELASLAHRAVADYAIAVTDNAGVLLEVEVRPLVLQISLRERGLTVQRRLERRDELGHRRRVGGGGRCGEGALHFGATLRHQGCPHSRFAAAEAGRLHGSRKLATRSVRRPR
jgi:hypothetical protein